jgi:cobalt-zinc-cadmium efflux system protein
LETVLARDYRITHTTLQVDHAPVEAGATREGATELPLVDREHCVQSHGRVHRLPDQVAAEG